MMDDVPPSCYHLLNACNKPSPPSSDHHHISRISFLFLVVIFSKFSVLTSKTCMLAELQETLDTATGSIQTTAVGHLHGALFVQYTIATQKLSCNNN